MVRNKLENIMLQYMINKQLMQMQKHYNKEQFIINLIDQDFLKNRQVIILIFFVSLLTSGAEFRGTPYEAALEFQVNQALDLSIADYNEKIDFIDNTNQSLLLAARARGEKFKGRMTAATEYIKAGSSLLTYT